MPPAFRLAARAGAALLLAACNLGQAVRNDRAQAPADAAAALLEADRAFAAASARTDLVSGLRAMFAPDVFLLSGGRIARGAAAADSLLRANADNARSRMQWTPIRAGVSADGRHGFTHGYMSITRPDGSVAPGKYVAYWVRGTEGWRVAAYKRTLRAPGEVSLAVRAPSLPARLVAPVDDPAVIARHAASLREAELAFSREAQGGTSAFTAAFLRNAAPDAYHTGGPQDAEFRHGPRAISEGVGGGGDGPVPTWAPRDVLVASSGDLGVTIGWIDFPAPPAGASGASGPAGPAAPRSVPFFTVWRREGAARPWRYVAE